MTISFPQPSGEFTFALEAARVVQERWPGPKDNASFAAFQKYANNYRQVLPVLDRIKADTTQTLDGRLLRSATAVNQILDPSYDQLMVAVAADETTRTRLQAVIEGRRLIDGHSYALVIQNAETRAMLARRDAPHGFIEKSIAEKDLVVLTALASVPIYLGPCLQDQYSRVVAAFDEINSPEDVAEIAAITERLSFLQKFISDTLQGLSNSVDFQKAAQLRARSADALAAAE